MSHYLERQDVTEELLRLIVPVYVLRIVLQCAVRGGGDMANLSVRVPEELQRKLDRESSASRRTRSDLIREAISEYVTRRERERELSAMEEAARAMAAAGGDRRPSAEEFLETDLEALELGERVPPAGGGTKR